MPGNILRDPAVRYGLKFGLAGVLAVYISLVIRLDNPGWALFTVFVLMVAQYVGAISACSGRRFRSGKSATGLSRCSTSAGGCLPANPCRCGSEPAGR